MSHSGLFRCVLVSNKSVINAIKPCSCPWQPHLQFVRGFRRPHIRKPLYLGTAKSKLLRFPNWVPYKPGEREEMQKLTCDYRHAMNCLFAYFKEEHAKVSETSHIAAAKQKADEEDHIRLIEENRLENERLAKIRQARTDAYTLQRQERLMQSFALAEENTKKNMETADQTIRKVNEYVSKCITPETLDDAIEQALANEVDYNFAIDLDGNVYKGRYTNKLETQVKTEATA